MRGFFSDTYTGVMVDLLEVNLKIMWCLLMTESVELTLRGEHIEPAAIPELWFRFLFLWRFLLTDFCPESRRLSRRGPDWEGRIAGCGIDILSDK